MITTDPQYFPLQNKILHEKGHFASLGCTYKKPTYWLLLPDFFRVSQMAQSIKLTIQ